MVSQTMSHVPSEMKVFESFFFSCDVVEFERWCDLVLCSIRKARNNHFLYLILIMAIIIIIIIIIISNSMHESAINP